MAKNGIHRSILLTKEQDDRLNRLLVATGMNRNALIRLWIEQSTPDGIREMQCH
jgi:predicted DNA-binding protein